jgi:hypothetical protein
LPGQRYSIFQLCVICYRVKGQRSKITDKDR